ncbi:MAG: chromate transporter [Cellulosilyticaceae bacterium]
MKVLLELFLVFARIGGFTFGGGYAMLPLMQREIVEKRGWATDEEVLDYYAIGQVTPGIIAVNTATFIGYKLKGLVGGIVATLGMVTPSIVIITLIAMFFENFMDYEIMQRAFGGIRVVVVALIAHTVYQMAKKAMKDRLSHILFWGSLVILICINISPVWVVIAGAVIGMMSTREKGGAKQ